MVAAKYLCDGQAPGRGRGELAGGLVCYRPYACSDGWVTLGALEPKFWQAWCRGVGREDLIEKQFDAPGSEAHAEVERIFLERTATSGTSSPSGTTAASSRCSASTRRSTPSSCGRARWWWSWTSRAPAGVRLLGVPVKLSRTPGAPAGRARRSASTPARCWLAGLQRGADRELLESGAAGRPPAAGSFMA